MGNVNRPRRSPTYPGEGSPATVRFRCSSFCPRCKSPLDRHDSQEEADAYAQETLDKLLADDPDAPHSRAYCDRARSRLPPEWRQTDPLDKKKGG